MSAELSSPPAPAGDRTQWFKEQVLPHNAHLKNYLRSAFPHVPDHEDVIQESNLKLWKAGGEGGISSVKAYLFTVARRIALGWLRRRKASPVESLGDFDVSRIMEDSPDAAEALGQNERIELAVQALMTLPPRWREVVMLRKLKGLSQKETAETLGVTVKTVDKHLAAGLARLEAHLRRRGVEGKFR